MNNIYASKELLRKRFNIDDNIETSDSSSV